jgi:Zn-dependent protease
VETYLPFKCPYCQNFFCSQHRLPESHKCPQYQWKEKALTIKEVKTTAPKIIIEEKSPYEYASVFTLQPYVKKRNITFSQTEIKHLLISLAIVIAIGISMTINPLEGGLLEEIGILGALLLGILFALIFSAHEIAHKIVAQRNGLWAEYRLTLMGALLTAISIFSPFFKIISPGAVMITGFYADKRTIGKVAFAGPLVNLLLSPLLFIIGLLTYDFSLIISIVALYGSLFNVWIALFNLIPLGILDGYKIFQWNKIVWATAFTFSIASFIMIMSILFKIKFT